MVTRIVVVSGSGDETASKLCDRNRARCVLVFRNTSTTKTVLVSDTVSVLGVFAVEPSGTLALLASDGYDVTQEYRAYNDDLGSSSCVVMEQFLPDVVMAKLEKAGITTTQGLGVLLLLAGLMGA